MIYKEDLERIREELDQRKADLLTELDQLPQGELYCLSKDGKKYYYNRIPATGNRKKEHRYGISRAPELIYDLVRKEYIVSALKIIDRDIKALQYAISHYKPLDENTVMSEFMKKNPELAEGVYRKPVDPEIWKQTFRPMDAFHEEGKSSKTAGGEKTLSKNELYIASRLDHYGLVYRHDCPTGIPGLYRNPDFQILRPRDYKIIYWEHFGMMDDREYFIDYKRKMEEYEEHGIVPWDNLIATYSYTKGGLDGRMIESMIRGWLL